MYLFVGPEKVAKYHSTTVGQHGRAKPVSGEHLAATVSVWKLKFQRVLLNANFIQPGDERLPPLQNQSDACT
jgi:hypothetical protein